MVVTLQNHSGIPPVPRVSRGGAATHIVQWFSTAPSGVSEFIVLFRHGSVSWPFGRQISRSQDLLINNGAGGANTIQARMQLHTTAPKELHRRCLAKEGQWLSPSGINLGSLTVHCHEHGTRGAVTDSSSIVRRYGAGAVPLPPSPKCGSTRLAQHCIVRVLHCSGTDGSCGPIA